MFHSSGWILVCFIFVYFFKEAGALCASLWAESRRNFRKPPDLLVKAGNCFSSMPKPFHLPHQMLHRLNEFVSKSMQSRPIVARVVEFPLGFIKHQCRLQFLEL